MIGWDQQIAAIGQFQQRDAFLDRTSGDDEEIAPIGFRETTVTFGPGAPGLAAIEREARGKTKVSETESGFLMQTTYGKASPVPLDLS